MKSFSHSLSYQKNTCYYSHQRGEENMCWPKWCTKASVLFFPIQNETPRSWYLSQLHQQRGWSTRGDLVRSQHSMTQTSPPLFQPDNTLPHIISISLLPCQYITETGRPVKLCLGPAAMLCRGESNGTASLLPATLLPNFHTAAKPSPQRVAQCYFCTLLHSLHCNALLLPFTTR